ncbi:MAG: hypothetical protein QOE41_255 [Mycobacterium sp.]|jgi:hypothetical protein|nr:hypothetical protein [Mycobacterium sp.]
MEVDMDIVVFGANGQTGRLRTRHALTASPRLPANRGLPADGLGFDRRGSGRARGGRRR